MTDPAFDRLAAVAREEAPPSVDVADRVIRAIQDRPRAASVEPEFLWVGIGSLVAAGVAYFFLGPGAEAESSLALIQPFVSGLP